MLEDVALVEEQKREKAKQKSKRKTRFEEAEEEAGTGRKTLLSKYESDSEGEVVRIGASGLASASARDDDVTLQAAGRVEYDLTFSLGAAVDYADEEERPAEFKKKKRKSKASSAPLPRPPGGEPETAADLVAELEAQAGALGADHASRSGRGDAPAAVAAGKAAAEADAKRREANYARAIAKANEASSALEHLEDDDLAASLARARRLAQAKKPAPGSFSASLVAAREAEEEAVKSEADGAMVFSDLTEFVRTVGTVKAEPSEATTTTTTTAAAAAAASAQIKVEGEVKVKREDVKLGAAAEDEEEEEEGEVKTSVPAADIFVEPSVRGGISGALELIRQRGLLGGNNNNLAGRDRDKRADRHDDGDDDGEGPRIEHIDKFGRKLTKKEAYRELSYAFHGQTPGKNKQAKLLKKLEEERKARSGAMPASFQSLQRAQAETGQAHLVISGSAQSKDQQWAANALKKEKK